MPSCGTIGPVRTVPYPPIALLFAAAGLLALTPSAIGSAPAPGGQRCFGAAAMDVDRPCVDRTLSVVPKPDDGKRLTSTYCAPIKQQRDPEVCTFGTRRAKADAHVALIGDSHALQWRTPLDLVVRVKRWHASAITTPGCFYSEAVLVLARGLNEVCEPWYRSVRAWLVEHPEVSTVIVSQSAPTAVSLEPGETTLGVKSGGFQRAWRSLPATVKHVVVIRDTPRISDDTFDCVRRVMALRERAKLACAVPRAQALVADPAVAAVRALRSTRYGVVDTTDFFCGSRRCYPVIGGVLTHADVDHINAVYAGSLGPYLLRKLRRLTARW